MYVSVVVHPSAKKERFEVISEQSFSVHVKEPAERNLANKRVVSLVASHFLVDAHEVRIISGHRSRKKVLSVEVESAVL